MPKSDYNRGVETAEKERESFEKKKTRKNSQLYLFVCSANMRGRLYKREGEGGILKIRSMSSYNSSNMY